MSYPTELADFLLARIAEDEAAVTEGLKPDFMDNEPTYYSSFGAHRDDWGLWTFHVPPARVLAECDAKRRIITWDADQPVERGILALLALPYADHPDYDAEWAP